MARNIAADVAPPKVPKTKARAFTAAEVERLLASCEGGWHTLWLLALYTGMRLGELLGLPWDAIVEDVGDGTREGEVTVRQVLAEGEDADLYLRGYTKSEAGFRTIRIPDFVAAELGRHRERQAAVRRAASRWEHDGLVFVSRFGTFLLRSNVIRAFKRECADARPSIAGPVNPHLCRHTFASHLFAERRPITEISYVLGHSSRSVTLDIYGHFLSTEGQGTPSALARSYRGAGRRCAGRGRGRSPAGDPLPAQSVGSDRQGP